jgi:hypothetical protein
MIEWIPHPIPLALFEAIADSKIGDQGLLSVPVILVIAKL